jgi:hypothetical protein
MKSKILESARGYANAKIRIKTIKNQTNGHACVQTAKLAKL